MPQIRIECALPFSLALADGDYADNRREPLRWNSTNCTFSSGFHSDEVTRLAIDSRQTSEARSLIVRINRLIRWYRVITSDTSLVNELTLWKASPFRFFIDDTNGSWGKILTFSPPLALQAYLKYTSKFSQLSENIRHKFANGTEPPVVNLFLLDAHQAFEDGRFREAVLFLGVRLTPHLAANSIRLWTHNFPMNGARAGNSSKDSILAFGIG